jgi:hypothetical protein
VAGAKAGGGDEVIGEHLAATMAASNGHRIAARSVLVRYPPMDEPAVHELRLAPRAQVSQLRGQLRIGGRRIRSSTPGYRCGLQREHTQLYATRLKATDFETGVVASAFVWQ